MLVKFQVIPAFVVYINLSSNIEIEHVLLQPFTVKTGCESNFDTLYLSHFSSDLSLIFFVDSIVVELYAHQISDHSNLCSL